MASKKMTHDDSRQLVQRVGFESLITQENLPVPEFTLLSEFTWFLAEWATVELDVVVHFFPRANGKSDGVAYWTKRFGELVSEHAMRVFGEGQPNLTLQYFDVGGLVPYALSHVEGIEGYPSWCLVARGFGGLFAAGKVRAVCEAVETASQTST